MSPRKVLARFGSSRASDGGGVRRSVRLGVCLTAALSALVVSAFAEGGATPAATAVTMDTISTMTTTQLTAVQQALLNCIQSIVPLAIVVFGSLFVVEIGKRVFRRFAS